MIASRPSLSVELTQKNPIFLDVSLRCGSGELLALTGPSGSGKTTVLRAIAGLHRVESGSIKCKEQLWQDDKKPIFLTPQQRRVGLVFQHYALFPHLTVLENVTTAMSHVRRKMRTDKAMEWLRLTNMDGLHKQRPDRLSGGQRQRVALARALAREPEVLLLDEPFSAVDQLTRGKLYRELAQIRTQLDVPMILVTHDMIEVQQLADSLCLIHHGSTLQSGPMSQVMRKPDTARIAKLLGHKNLYTGTYTSDSFFGTVEILGVQIVVDAQPLFQNGSVAVLVEPSAIIMHRSDRPSHGERENPIATVVAEAVELGDDLSLRLTVKATNELLAFRVSRHVAARNKVEVGGNLTVSILSEGIHIMAPDDNNSRAAERSSQ